MFSEKRSTISNNPVFGHLKIPTFYNISIFVSKYILLAVQKRASWPASCAKSQFYETTFHPAAL